MTVFDKFAAAFPLVSDEDQRWTKEGALILDLARSAGEGKGRMLDLACGSGFHARHLAMNGFAVTGVDISAAAMKAGRSLPGGEKVNWTEGDITQPVNGEYDFVLLIGNTLSLFETKVQVEKAIEVASKALVPRGLLLVHVIDYDHLRAHPVRIERKGNLKGVPVTFEKRIDADDTGAVIAITVTTETASGPRVDSATQRLHEWGALFLEEVASRVGLELRHEFGSLDGIPSVPGQTKDVVLVYEK